MDFTQFEKRAELSFTNKDLLKQAFVHRSYINENKDNRRARQYILANALEALIGAVYIDQGYNVAKDFIEKNFTPLIDTIISAGSHVDAKSLFQEKAQEFDGITPSYKTIKESGPDHGKKFTVGVYVGKELIAQGEGDSKQDAEQSAARAALAARGWK